MRISLAGVALTLICAPVAARAQAGGELVRDTVHSRAIEGNLYGDTPDRPLLIYLPPSYRKETARHYPVVYLLHGFGGTENAWAQVFPVKQAMDSALRAGTAHEMIVVMPSGRNKLNGSFYVNSATTGGWDDFIAKELVAYVDGKYRTMARPASRGLAGHSMGGFGTFAVGMRHAGDVFGALYATSACCTTPGLGSRPSTSWDTLAALTSLDQARRLSFLPQVLLALSAAFAPDVNNPPLFVDFAYSRRDGAFQRNEGAVKGWIANSPYYMIPSSADRLKRLRGLMFDVGTHDQLVAPAELFAMDTALTRAGVAHKFETFDGDHTNHLTERLALSIFPFFSRTLDFGTAPER